MQAIDSSTTAQVIADRIRAAIIRGALKPHDRLIEAELSRTFDVSRGPVREAIRLLAADGVVVLRKNRGAVVSSPTMDDVVEVYALRLALGGIAIAAVAEARAVGEREAASLSRLVDKLRDAKVQADADRMIDADLAFQTTLVELSGLPRFTESFRRTDTDIRLFVRALGIKYDDQDHRKLADRHDKLVAAVRAGDADRADHLWRTHITNTVREFTRGEEDLDHTALAHLLTARA